MILITGAGGMLGRYLLEQFGEGKDESQQEPTHDKDVFTLGLRPESDFCIDLSQETPDFGEKRFETVVHAAGTEEEEGAMELNLEGTKHLLSALTDTPPNQFVYISSYKVYSRDAGENVTEESNTWATDKTGRSKALTEEYVRNWCKERGVTLSIIRPARMFGEGVKGETLRLFNDALTGKYIHIRGNDSKISVVCALDVARGIKKVYKTGGIYNAADPIPVRLIDLVESLTANAGAKKRMSHLPPSWAEWLWRLGRWIPSISRNLDPKVVEGRMKTLTLDGSHFEEISGINYHDTIAVIERRDKTYPYKDNPR
ncbi:MAG: NAD(P)-dependent oxidoreductase [Muribaculaceae bacterium]|nr:NAD(P)-dependent oxidoreductase [Muribaculaceae bacterium]